MSQANSSSSLLQPQPSLAGATPNLPTLVTEAQRRADLQREALKPSWVGGIGDYLGAGLDVAYEIGYGLVTGDEAALARSYDAADRPTATALGDTSAAHGLTAFMLRQSYEPDPNFRVTEELIREHTKGLPDEAIDGLGRSVSLEDFLFRVEDRRQRFAARQQLADLGATGFGLSLAAGVLDPVFLGANAATLGLAAPWIAGGAGGRLAMAMKAGLVSAGTNVGVQAVSETDDPLASPYSLPMAAAFSFLHVPIVGAGVLRKAWHDKAATRMMQDALDAEIKAAGLRLTSKGEQFVGTAVQREAGLDGVFRVYADAHAPGVKLTRDGRTFEVVSLDGDRVTMRDLQSNTVADMPRGNVVTTMRAAEAIPTTGVVYDTSPLAPSPIEGMDGVTVTPQPVRPPSDIKGMGASGESAGAGDVQVTPDQVSVRQPHQAGDFTVDDVHLESPSPFRNWLLGPLRNIPFIRGIAVTGGQSPSQTMRAVMKASVEDVVPRRDPLNAGAPEPSTYSATEWTHTTTSKINGVMVRATDSAFKAWLKETGQRWVAPWKRRTLFRQFDRETIETIARGEKGEGAIAKSVAAKRAAMKETFELGQRHGAIDPRLKFNPNHVPSLIDVLAINNLSAELKTGEMVRLTAGSFRAANPFLTEYEATAMAAKWLNNAKQVMYKDTLSEAVMLDGPDRGWLDLHADDIFAQRRADMLAAGKTAEEVTAAIKQILDDILPDGTKSNVSFLKKATAMDRNFALEDAQLLNGGTRRLAFRDILINDATTVYSMYNRRLIGASAEHGILDRMSVLHGQRLRSWSDLWNKIDVELRESNVLANTHKDAKRLFEDVRAMLRGHPIGETKYSDAMRLIREYNYSVRAGGFGITQAMETVGMMARHPGDAFQVLVPQFRALIAKMRGGHYTDDALADIEALGYGNSRLLMRYQADPGDSAVMAVGATMSKMGRMAKGLRNTASDLNFLAPMTAWAEKVAAHMAMQRWYRIARTGKLPSAKRLAGLGVSPEMARKIAAQMAEHATPGTGGSRLGQLNLDQWDMDAASAFQGAVSKWSRRAIQQNDPGQLALWMHGDVGRLLIQFRLFPIAAMEKQLAYGLRMSDVESYVQFATAAAVGGLGYLGMTHLAALGRDDRQDFLDKALTMEKVISAGWARSGWSALLPTFADTAYATVSGGETIFAPFRVSGLANDPVFGNPVFAMWDAKTQAASGLTNLLRGDRDFAQTNLYALRAFVPYATFFPVRNGFNMLANELPRRPGGGQ